MPPSQWPKSRATQSGVQMPMPPRGCMTVSTSPSSMRHTTQQHKRHEVCMGCTCYLQTSAYRLTAAMSAAVALCRRSYISWQNQEALSPAVTDLSCDALECAAIDEVRTRGDSCGGEVTCVVRSPPMGLGSPVFDKLEAELAKAAMSLPASKVSLKHWMSQFRGPVTSLILASCPSGSQPRSRYPPRPLDWVAVVLRLEPNTRAQQI